eukprot:CAMPEP_0115140274 /NCGR_PEP_ID=MMETSP0227-20121206/58832_1 /TAXON_ID=89957 /ORGANISM="Polarella glacialis, Strain CCMP 1383" /LENGTH=81 /DNA_ID=CAMNT_0002548389 /DNA_START=59 /DNA_END=301 /DNA_ORIENTATION=+
MLEKALGHFRGFMPPVSDAQETSEVESLPSSERTLEDEVARKYQEMQSLGWSERRVRVAMVRDGLLTPGAAFENNDNDNNN